MLFVLQLLQLTAKRLMMRLAIQQLGKHDRVPPLAAACGDLGMEERSHADSVNLNTMEAGLSQRQLFDSFRDTIWPPWQSRRNRQGGRSSPADFSTFLFPTFQREQNLCGAHQDGAVIKHAGFSEIIQHFDTFIVSCLIY